MILFCFIHNIKAQEILLRTTSSVDIQVCAPQVLSTERDSIMEAVGNRLQSVLSSTAVYHARTYTTAIDGGVCFLFVYQAPSPMVARNAVPLFGDVLDVQYEGFPVRCAISLVPWSGLEKNTLGLPWSWTGQDILLWGSCVGIALLFCVIGACFYVQITLNKERLQAQELYDQDKKMIARMVKKLRPQVESKNNQGSILLPTNVKMSKT